MINKIEETNNSTASTQIDLKNGHSGMPYSDMEVATTSNAEQNVSQSETSTTRNESHIYSVDDIGVMLDYQPPPFVEETNNTDITEESTNSRFTAERSCTSGRRRRRHRRPAIGRASSYSKQFFVQCLSGIFTGAIFLVTGILLIVEINNKYLGVLFVLVSLPPFLMVMYRCRNVRQTIRYQRQILERRGAVRRMQEAAREDEAYRQGSLPFSDEPPSYDNLGFSDFTIISDSSSEVNSDSSSFVSPPDYSNSFAMEKYVEDDASKKNGYYSGFNDSTSSTQDI